MRNKIFALAGLNYLYPWTILIHSPYALNFSAVLTILASDQANGIVNFNSADNVTLIEPSASTTSTENTEVIFTLTRAPGIYGIVRVPFQVVTSEGQGGVTDLTPTSGTAIFQDREVS